MSVIDIEGGTYYAQVRGLLQDQYCEKSAVLTWLLPSKDSPKPENCFDPSSYVIGKLFVYHNNNYKPFFNSISIGPDEDIPRKLDYLQFVCHAPSEYFHDKYSPYATKSFKPESCFIWSKMGPVIRPIEKASNHQT